MNEIERIYPADGFVRSIEWPDPTPEMLDTILFDTIWRVIKTWDINVPHAYSGYMGATGNHARAIYAAIAAMRGEPVAWMYSNPSDPLPPSIQAQRHDAMDFIAMRRRGWTETPLYAWPATDAENQRLRAEVEALREDCRKLLENEPVATCESCGTWLLDGDDYVTDPDGVAGCWAAMTDVPSKTERKCYAYRVGKCDARAALTRKDAQ
jgi:hypothetical protein